MTPFRNLASENVGAGHQANLDYNNNNNVIYYALINALSAHMIHINLNMIFYTHVEHSPTKTIYKRNLQ